MVGVVLCTFWLDSRFNFVSRARWVGVYDRGFDVGWASRVFARRIEAWIAGIS